jgi:hypothetical protein
MQNKDQSQEDKRAAVTGMHGSSRSVKHELKKA